MVTCDPIWKSKGVNRFVSMPQLSVGLKIYFAAAKIYGRLFALMTAVSGLRWSFWHFHAMYFLIRKNTTSSSASFTF